MLTEADYSIEVDPSGVKEPEPSPGTDPIGYVARLAWEKAAAVAGRRRKGLILAADTVCAVEGQILGKPADRDDAERMIRLQEGRDTDVLTGLCLYRAGGGEWVGAVEVSVVRFRPLDAVERAHTSTRIGGRASRAPTASRTVTRSSRSPGGASPTSSGCQWSGSPRCCATIRA